MPLSSHFLNLSSDHSLPAVSKTTHLKSPAIASSATLTFRDPSSKSTVLPPLSPPTYFQAENTRLRPPLSLQSITVSSDLSCLKNDPHGSLLRYYNNTYADTRGPIQHLCFLSKKTLLIPLLGLLHDNHLHKVILSEVKSDHTIIHSEPLLIKGKNIVLLRDSGFMTTWNAYLVSIKNRGFHVSFPKDNGYSFQGDGNSCHLLSLLILKDITPEKALLYISLDNDYMMLPHQLKYCQSQNYAAYYLRNGELGKSFTNAKGEVKKDKKTKKDVNITLGDYIGTGDCKRAEKKFRSKLQMIAANPPVTLV